MMERVHAAELEVAASRAAAEQYRAAFDAERAQAALFADVAWDLIVALRLPPERVDAGERSLFGSWAVARVEEALREALDRPVFEWRCPFCGSRSEDASRLQVHLRRDHKMNILGGAVDGGLPIHPYHCHLPPCPNPGDGAYVGFDSEEHLREHLRDEHLLVVRYSEE